MPQSKFSEADFERSLDRAWRASKARNSMRVVRLWPGGTTPEDTTEEELDLEETREDVQRV